MSGYDAEDESTEVPPESGEAEAEAEVENEAEWIPIYPGMRARVMLITPKIAARLLAKNDPENRNVAWNRVTGYSTDMLGKRWKLTHQGICINDDNDTMIDGQHRLQAVIMAAVPVLMLVVRVSDITIHDSIDRGGVRTVAFVTGLDRNITSACSALRMLEYGYQTNAQVTPGETQEIYEHHKDAFDVLGKSLPAKKNWAPAGVYAACIWGFPINSTKTQQFLHQVQTGELIQRNDPAYALREWLKKGGKRVGSWHRSMAALNALRYHLSEERLVTIHTTETGYRSLCARRRQLGIPHTPAADQVEAASGGGIKIKRDREEES
jgi:hypothetical protein